MQCPSVYCNYSTARGESQAPCFHLKGQLIITIYFTFRFACDMLSA